MDTKINWYKKDIDEVLDALYNKIEENDNSFEFFKHLIAEFPELDIDWLEAFEDMKNDLLWEEKIDDILFFINWYSKKILKIIAVDMSLSNVIYAVITCLKKSTNYLRRELILYKKILYQELTR